MKRMQQIAVQVPNRYGTLAEICHGLAESQVNIIAIMVPESGHSGIIRILPDNLEESERVLRELELPFTTEEVISLELTNQPGELARISEDLGIAQVGIDYLYATTDGDGRSERVILGVTDTDRAVELLQERQPAASTA